MKRVTSFKVLSLKYYYLSQKMSSSRIANERQRLMMEQFNTIALEPIHRPSPRRQQQSRLGSFQSLCTKLQKNMEIQNQRLKSIQLCLAQLLGGKLDRLIQVSISMKEQVVRAVGRAVRKVKDRSLEKIMKTEPNTQANQYYKQNQKLQSITKFNILPESYTISNIPSRNNSPKSHEKKDQTSIILNYGIVSEIPTTQTIPIRISNQILPKNKIQNLSSEQTKNLRNNAEHKQQIVQPDPIIEDFETKKRKFLGVQKKKIGQFISALTEEMYSNYSKKGLDLRELKSRFSWEIVSFVIDAGKRMKPQLKEMRQAFGYDLKVQVLQTMDEALRNALEFLIKKYPPSKHKILDTELLKHIIPINKTNDAKYDILANAGMSFQANQTKSDFTSEIKIWINKIIMETKRKFPQFKRFIKDLFVGKETSCFDGGESEVEYEIGCKISDNVEPYSDSELRKAGLGTKSPQIIRILVKWIRQLFANFEQQTKIIGNKVGFKSLLGVNIVLPTSRKISLFDKLKEIKEKQNRRLKDEGIERLYGLIGEVLLMVEQGIEDKQQLIEQEVIISKIAQYLDSCGEAYARIILSSLIKALNSIRQFYNEEDLQSHIDLITFNVMDLLRCKCVGSKHQIKRIFDQLSNSHYCEIIRVKNKLNEGTRDILINFKIRDSFLIGQMQLSLGDSKDETNDHFCHYLYQLQRGVFPVLMQASSQIACNDTRVSYFDSHHPVIFRKNQRVEELKKSIKYFDSSLRCFSFHAQKQMDFHINNIPFCCAYCSKFIRAFESCLEFMGCNVCRIAICPNCIIENIPEMSLSYISRYLDLQTIQTYFADGKPLFTGFGNHDKIIKKVVEILKTEPYVLWFQFDSRSPKQTLYKMANGQPIRTFYTIQGMPQHQINDSPSNWNSIVLPKPHLTMKLEDLKHYTKRLIQRSLWHQVSQLFKQAKVEQVIVVRHDSKKQVMILDIVEDNEKIIKKQIREDMIHQIEYQNKKLEINLELTSKQLIDLGILQLIKDKQKLKTINLWDNKLVSLKELEHFPNITEIHLHQNIIKSLQDAPQFSKLIHLNLQKNSLSGVLPKLNLPQLAYLDVSHNTITNINSLSNQLKLRCLFLVSNHLTQLPILHLPDLEFLFFSKNFIKDITDFCQSKIPKLKRLHGLQNQIEGDFPVISNMPALRVIVLKGNRIEGLKGFTESNLPQLQFFNLSDNCLEGALPVIKMSKIQKVFLNDNEITSIQNIQHWETPEINLVNLNNNKINQPLPPIRLLELQQLLLDANEIEDIKQFCEHSFLPKLSILVISSNKICTLHKFSFSSLDQLYLSHNIIAEVLILSKWSLPKLRTLDLRQNRISSDIPILDFPCLEKLLLGGNHHIKQLLFLQEHQLVPNLSQVTGTEELENEFHKIRRIKTAMTL